MESTNISRRTCRLDSVEASVERVPATATDQGSGKHEVVAVNGRFRAHKMAGLQRYAEELVSRMGSRLRVIEPSRRLTGVIGHAWEQVALPLRADNHLLWSPCNFGPMNCSHHVVTLHDVFPLDYPGWFSPNFVRVFRYLVPRLVRKARAVIAVSEYTRSRILAAVPEASDKIVVIYSGISSRFSPHVDISPLSARAIPKNYLLSVSSLQPRKNMRFLLKAWKRALPEIPTGTWLVIAGAQGKPSVFGDLNFGDLPERVMLAGYFPDELLPALYAGARAFVFPSLAEGFGFPPLEAMACGTPVLTSNTTSLAELTQDAAYLVDPTDIDSTALGIRRVATDDDLCSSLRIRGLSQIKQFRWESTANKTWDLLEGQLVAAMERRTRPAALQKIFRRV